MDQNPQEQGSEPQSLPQIQEDKKATSSILVIALVAALILTAGFVGYQFMTKKNLALNPKTEPTTSNTKPNTQPAPQVASDEKSLNAIDQDMTNLNNDLSATDNSLNDKPGDLSEN